jgi:hypothetical protein
MLATSFIYGGQAFGDVAPILLANNMDPGALRPWRGKKGRSMITVFNGFKDDGVTPTFKNIVTNAPATVTRDAWKQIDQAVTEAAMPRMRFVNRIRAAGLTYNVPNAMGKTVLESGVMGRITPATISMDPVRKGDADQMEQDINLLPLPIIHKDTNFTARQIAVSRSGNMPFDDTWFRMAAEEVAIEAERLFLGTSVNNGYKYGGGYVWGLLNFPQRMTKPDLTDPDGNWGGAGPVTLVNEIIEMREMARAANQYGPWVLVMSPAWEAYLDLDYNADGDMTVRQRILAIEGIDGIETMDYIDDGGLHIVMMNANARTVRAVVGFDIQTVQWPSQGGMVQNFKVMAMIVPQFRADINGSTGVVHGQVP